MPYESYADVPALEIALNQPWISAVDCAFGHGNRGSSGSPSSSYCVRAGRNPGGGHQRLASGASLDATERAAVVRNFVHVLGSIRSASVTRGCGGNSPTKCDVGVLRGRGAGHGEPRAIGQVQLPAHAATAEGKGQDNGVATPGNARQQEETSGTDLRRVLPPSTPCAASTR